MRIPLKLAISLILCSAPAAFANAAAPDETARLPDLIENIIVTGRAGVDERTKEETSYSITAIDEDALRMQAPTSVTESLKSVPGFWVEASGGEASGNVRARGIPVDGFGSITLLEDGNDSLSVFGYIDNISNSLGLTEGNPRAGELQSADAGANTFIARPILGRSYRLALMYRF